MKIPVLETQVGYIMKTCLDQQGRERNTDGLLENP